jgi:hypothetical protein
MLPIGLKLKSWALTAWAVLLVLVGAYVMGSRAAKKAAEKKSNYNEALRDAAGAKEVHNAELDTRKLPTGGAAEQLRRDWMRDDHPAAPHAGTEGDSGDRT